jgi:hypothetical protein
LQILSVKIGEKGFWLSPLGATAEESQGSVKYAKRGQDSVKRRKKKREIRGSRHAKFV